MPDNPTATPGLAPTDESMKNLAGSFISIRAANKAILLQPELTLPTNQEGKLDEVIENMKGINQALKTARDHATEWNTTISGNVQNQLQQIVSQSEFGKSLGEPINEAVDSLKSLAPDAPEIKSTLQEIHELAEALADNINTILYGIGNTIDDYADGTDYPTDTIYGSYKQLSRYQSEVAQDNVTFKGYITSLKSDDAGIDAQIENINSDIESYRRAISNDQMMIAGGSAAIATGVVLVVVAVALAPETAGGSMAIGAVGVAAIAGGAAADVYGVVDLMKKEDKMVEAKRHIQELNADKAALVSIKDASQGIIEHTEVIFNALGQIVANWQQMQNNITNTMEAIKSIDDPDGQLQKWIEAASNSNPGGTKPFVMSIILNARLTASAKAWNKAADTAQALLNGIANTVEKVLPPNTEINQQTIDHVALTKAA